jgi:membrane-associated phospholipid phosphatase
LVSVAMADAFIVCWNGKYTYWTARPNQVIPGFAAYIKTPPFPGYPSGHSTQSGAASEVLAYLFPQHAATFHAMAEEAAISRLYGGIHFQSDNNSGLAVGREVGRRVVEYAKQDGG